jgi:hypothetical protein
MVNVQGRKIETGKGPTAIMTPKSANEVKKWNKD